MARSCASWSSSWVVTPSTSSRQVRWNSSSRSGRDLGRAGGVDPLVGLGHLVVPAPVALGSESHGRRGVSCIALGLPGYDAAGPFLTRSSMEKPRHGGHLIAQALKNEGVTHFFTLSGGHIAPIYDGCVDLGIEVVDFRHEQSAAHAADGWARVTLSVGVAG